MDELLLDDVLEDELLLLYDARMHHRGPVRNRPRFRLEEFTDNNCVDKFRFDRPSLVRLREALHFPWMLRCRNGKMVESDEALCILLRRLAYPNRLTDLQDIFNCDKLELSLIFNASLEHVYTNYRGLLQDVRQWWLDIEHMQMYADAIAGRGAPLPRCSGFIDGTVRPICRPGHDQQEVYNGHKRVHGLKFQSVMIPNGLIGNLFGPIEGRRHDSAMLGESNLLQQLDGVFEGLAAEDMYYLYGDPAYPLRPTLIAPFRAAHVTPEQQDFNHRMNSCRQSVEWGFSKIIQQFAFLDYKKNLKLYLQPVGKYYLVGAILANCHTCLYGSQTGMYFNLEPPQLEQYLNGL